MRKFKQYVMKKIYLDEEIFIEVDNEVKVGYLNINGVGSESHSYHLNNDHNLKNLNILVLSETKIQQNHADSKLKEDLSNWTIKGRYDAIDGGNHMGLLLLTSNNNDSRLQIEHVEEFNVKRKGSLQCQGILVRLKDGLRLGFIYCRSTPNNQEVEQIKKYFAECDVLMGDLNLSHKIDEEKGKIRKLCEPRKFSALTEITRSASNNQLDYILLNNKFKNTYLTGSFFNFISDHKSIFIRLSLSLSNKFKNEIKERLTFDRELHLKQRKTAHEDEDECYDHNRVEDTIMLSDESDTEEEEELDVSKRITRNYLYGNTKSNQEIFCRRFHNPDSATCWLNSCLQLILIAMDYDGQNTIFNSQLGAELKKLQLNSDGLSLNPTTVKDILVSTDDTRIAMRLSELENEIIDQYELERQQDFVRNTRLNLIQGQQCSRDFFICLSQNESVWPDVFSLLKFDIVNSTICGKCHYKSESTMSDIYRYMPVPPENSNLNSFIEDFFNSAIPVDYQCEQCKNHSRALHKSSIKDLKQVQNVVIIISRAFETVDGYEVVKHKVTSTGEVILR